MFNYQNVLFTIYLILISNLGLAQSVVKGYVIDDKTDEKIPNAVLVINNSKNYLSDSTGFFSFNLSEGNYDIQINALGFLSNKLQLEILDHSGKELFIRLIPAPVLIEGVTVTGERFTKEINSYTYELKPGDLSKIPQVGEPDAMRSIQALPGVTAINDLSSLIFLRGGNFDETLISLDNVPIYNPYHLGEMFSSINPDIIQLQRLYTSNYPSNYGDYLSGILDLKSKSNNKLNGSVSLSTLSSKVSANIPISSGILTLAARRTYFDLVGALTGMNFPYYFYDMYGKYEIPFDENNLLEASVFFTRDTYDIFSDEEYEKSSGSKNPSWGNLLLSTKYTHYFNKEDYFNFNIYLSNSTLNANAEAKVNQLYNLDESNPDSTNSLFIDNAIIENGIISAFSFGLEGQIISMGAELKKIQLKSNWNLRENDLSGILKYPFQEVFFDFAPNPYSSNDKLFKYSFYLLDNIQLTKDAELIAGIRSTYLSVINNFFFTPYLLSIYRINENLQLKFSFGSYYQYLYTIKDQQHEELYAPFSSYFVANHKDQVSHSNHYTIGIEFKELIENFNLNVEAYYKTRENLASSYKLDRSITFEDGSVKGLEIFLKKVTGFYNGWISYSLSRSVKENKDYTYFSNYDRTHSVKILANFNLSDIWTFSSFWTYTSGLPATPAIGKYLRGNDYLNNHYGFPTLIDYEGRVWEIIEGRKNSIRLSDFSRLDIGITGNFLWGKVMIKPYLQVLNVYNSFNPYFYSASGNDTSINDGEDRGSFVIPTIGVTVEF